MHFHSRVAKDSLPILAQAYYGRQGSHWTSEEDQKLRTLAEQSSAKWSEIATKIGGGRSGVACQIRYYKLLKKKRIAQAQQGSTAGA
jgi:hypothetical protein